MLIRQLNSNELQMLRSVLGRSVPKVYAPNLAVCRLWYAAPHFSLPLGGEFLVVESDWADTRKEAIDYHTMRVSIADHPRDIPKVFDKAGRKMIGSPVSTVEIGEPKSEIVSVTVLERQKTGREEAVKYDSGLVFTLADGRRFALGTRESIAGGLECSTDSACIDELLAEDGVRQILS